MESLGLLWLVGGGSLPGIGVERLGSGAFEGSFQG